jgi:hypothetical protein
MALDRDQFPEAGTRARPDDPVSDIKPGIPVHTIDGTRIGEVKEVSETSFKVDAPMRPDYWVRRDAVQAFSIERVTLTVDKDHLDDAKAPTAG